MSLLIAPDTPYGKELWKWDHLVTETHPTDKSIRGMSNPSPYPMMLYKATQKNPWKFESETVADEREQRNLESRGFVAGGPQKAADAYDGDMLALATAAAHRNYEDRNMSERAREHSNTVEQASSRHLGEIPSERIPVHRRKRGPNKPKAPVPS